VVLTLVSIQPESNRAKGKLRAEEQANKSVIYLCGVPGKLTHVVSNLMF